MLIDNRKKRRATVLLLVVTLLALLFVIVTGYLSLARTNRAVTVEVQKSELTENIVGNISKMGVSMIKDQILNDQGKILAGGNPGSYAAEDIPGYRDTNYLAPLEPYWDTSWTNSQFGLTGTWDVLERIKWSSVTTLDRGVKLDYTGTGAPPANRMKSFALYELLRDYDFSDYNPTNPTFKTTDVQWNARIPFMDADGDGVPDSHFLLTAAGTEIANTMAGKAVKLPSWGDSNNFQIWNLPAFGDLGTYNDDIWQQYNENARYEVAMRIISHGGMVTLDSPTLYKGTTAYTPFNRLFTMSLFDTVGDTYLQRKMSIMYANATPQNRLFDELHEYQSAVEQALRRRFILPGLAVNNRGDYTTWVPPVLAELQGQLQGTGRKRGFPAIFFPTFQTVSLPNDPENWQRINIADKRADAYNLRYGWACAVSYDPVMYDTASSSSSGGGGATQPNGTTYDRRHLMTTVNNSDDLARRQNSVNPTPTTNDPLGLPNDNSALYEGELKFYLGEIAKAYEPADVGGGKKFTYNYAKGSLIIERMARLFYEMLASHSKNTVTGGTNDDWDTTVTNTTLTNNKEAVSRKQQALMLAVNTMSFATPRDTSSDTEGRIDTVVYTDNNGTPGDTNDDVVYYGYAPQPFITEVIAYCDNPDPKAPPEFSIAVELYNPNDPSIVPNTGAPNVPPEDVFGLNLSQYALTVDEVEGGLPNLVKVPLTGCGRNVNKTDQFQGRSFLTIVLKPSHSNNEFNTIQGQNTPAILLKDSLNNDLELNYATAQSLTVKLWRSCETTNNWYLVDVIKCDMPYAHGASQLWKSVYRDTSVAIDPVTYLPLFGGYDQDPMNYPNYARWNMIAAAGSYLPTGQSSPFEKTAGGTSASPGVNTLNNAKALTSSTQAFTPDVIIGRTASTTNVPFAPTVPLITMNASTLYKLPLFAGDDRPSSFPTVGFMLLIPRFSHVYGNGRSFPMGTILYKQWAQRGYNMTYGSYPPAVKYPVDFGHIPVFDNNQKIVSGSYLDTVKALPWGLLVFDYFTTIDPIADKNMDGVPDVDPLQIPGRININTAPWLVLSKLPLLGPVWTGGGNRYLPLNPPGSDIANPTPAFPSPAFWNDQDGTFVGFTCYNPTTSNWEPGRYRQLSEEAVLSTSPLYTKDGRDMPYHDARDSATPGIYRLGAWLAQAATSYRDGIQYLNLDSGLTSNYMAYADSHLRGADVAGQMMINGLLSPISWHSYRFNNSFDYGKIRGFPTGAMTRPTQFGFITPGELLNVKGFDSTPNYALNPAASMQSTSIDNGDYLRAVSLLVLLDSQYLTTRSNTFTVYTTVTDRENPEASTRSQVTVDRSNLLPRLTYFFHDPGNDPKIYTDDKYYPITPENLLNADRNIFPLDPRYKLNGIGVPQATFTTSNADQEPRVIAEETVGYSNARFDQ